MFAAILLLGAVSAFAQQRLDIERNAICTYYGEAVSEDLYGFQSDEEAQDFVAEILKHTGLPVNFTVMAANVPNASATTDKKNGERLVLYSQSFMADVISKSGTKWSATSIMAHELGHHLAGHTLLRESERRHDLELEADKFSGHILYKMGATMHEATAAARSIPSDKGTRTHPPKSARIAAVQNGWILAKEQAGEPHDPPELPPVQTPEPIPVPTSTPKPAEPRATVRISNIIHNINAPHPGGRSGGTGMSILVEGEILDAKGASAVVRVTFRFPNGQVLMAHPQESFFRSSEGYVATGSEHTTIGPDRVAISNARVYPIPYYALNLRATNHQTRWNLNATAEVYLNGRSVSKSEPFSFSVSW